MEDILKIHDMNRPSASILYLGEDIKKKRKQIRSKQVPHFFSQLLNFFKKTVFLPFSSCPWLTKKKVLFVILFLSFHILLASQYYLPYCTFAHIKCATQRKFFVQLIIITSCFWTGRGVVMSLQSHCCSDSSIPLSSTYDSTGTGTYR